MARDVVAFDAHHIGSGQGGNETYSRETLRAWRCSLPMLLPVVAAGNEQLLLERTGWRGPVATAFAHPVSRWTFGLGHAAKRHGAGILHTTYFAPLLRPKKLIVTIHDTSFHRFPAWFPPGRARAMRVAVRYAAAHADAIIAISEAMADDIAEAYPFAASRIRVVLIGAPSIAPLSWSEGPPAVRQPYILYVGNITPRKNLARLVEAFAIGRRRLRWSPDLQLKIVGRGDSRHLLAAAQQQGVANAVDIVGAVSDEHLAMLYAEAVAVTYLSLYEGFGLPVLEALAHGKPVVASDIPAHREVAGQCGIFADPYDAEAIAAAIEAALEGPPVNAAGIMRAEELSWAESARRLAAVYTEVLRA